MARYPQALIDHYREMYPVMEEFMICMGFLGAEDIDISRSLLKGNSTKEDLSVKKLKEKQPVKKQ